MAAGGHDNEPFAPELLAALTTIGLAVAVRLGPFETIRVSPVFADVGIASGIVIVIAFGVWWLGALRTTAQKYAATLVCSVVVLALLTGAFHWYSTKPGRDARSEAADGDAIDIPERDSTQRWESGPDGQYGSGWGEANEDYVRIHTNSNGSGMITWFATEDPGNHYYSEVLVRKVAGPWDTACVLIFGYRDENWWYGLRLRFDGFQFARFEGEIPATSFADGDLPYAEDLSRWHRLAVERHNREVRLFVDDHQVYSDEIDPDEDLDGGISFGTLDIGDGYSGQMECDFRDHVVRSM